MAKQESFATAAVVPGGDQIPANEDEENQFLQDIVLRRSAQARREIDGDLMMSSDEVLAVESSKHTAKEVQEEDGAKGMEVINSRTSGIPGAHAVENTQVPGNNKVETNDVKGSDQGVDQVAVGVTAGSTNEQETEGPGAFAVAPEAAPGGTVPQPRVLVDEEVGGRPPTEEAVVQSGPHSSLAVANPVANEEAATSASLPNASQVDLRQQQARAKALKQRTLKKTACLVLTGVTICAILVTGILLKSSRSKGSSASNTPAPSVSPSLAPTSLKDASTSYLLSLLPPFPLGEIITPQSLAFNWVLNDPNLPDYDDDQIIQRYAMATLYLSTIGEKGLEDLGDTSTPTAGLGKWRNDTNWLSYHHHECDWFMQSYYTEENLSLDDDYVYDYQIQQVIPDGPCDEDGNLRHIWLSENGLEGSIPAELALLTSLQTIDLTSNDLIGTIPIQVFTQLSNLELFFLYSEGLTGTLPTEIGLMSNLLHIELLSTSISGTLPTELGLLSSSLQVMEMDSNFISGTMPTELGLLSTLNVMVFGSTLLEGNIPSELGLLTSMFDCCLYACELSGTIPTELSGLTEMRFLIFEETKLSGTIPTEMGLLSTSMWFSLWGNQLSSSIPSQLGQLSTSTLHFWLEANQLTGSIPTQLAQLSLVQTLRLFGNQLTGKLPTELGTLQEVIALQLHDNKLTGTIPNEWKFSNALLDLRLSNNQLFGSLPSEMGLWGNLNTLLLNDNAFTGAIPEQLAPLGPNSTLQAVDLRNNSFTGTLPVEFCDLVSPEPLYCTILMQDCGPFLGIDCSTDNGATGMCGCGCSCS